MRRLLVLSLVLVTACGGPLGSIRVPAPTPYRLPATGRTIQVLAPRDARPRDEIQGRTPGMDYVVPLVALNFFGWSGSDLFPPERLAVEHWSAVHQGLLDHVQATGLFRAVRHDTPGDYVLESEVLHFVVAGFRDGWLMFGLNSIARLQHTFLPSATATLRLRLRDRAGRVIGERTVHGQVLGGPKDGSTAARAELARKALAQALRKARALVASWVLQDASPLRRADVARHLAARHAQGHSFIVYRHSRDRLSVELVRIACPSGRVVERWKTRRSELFPAGQPGHWIVSPYDRQGVRLTTAQYSALTRHLSQHFVLKRFDQLTAYVYVGKAPSLPADEEILATGQ